MIIKLSASETLVLFSALNDVITSSANECQWYNDHVDDIVNIRDRLQDNIIASLSKKLDDDYLLTLYENGQKKKISSIIDDNIDSPSVV